MEKLVYIDGDGLPYRVGFSTQRTVYEVVSEGAHSSLVCVTKSKAKVNKLLKRDPDLLVHEAFMVEDFMQALLTLKLALTGIVQGSKCNAFRVVLSDEDSNFRDEVAKPTDEIWKDSKHKGYKANRSGSEKPHHWRALRNWLLTMPYTIVTRGEEADDYVSKMIMQGHVGASNDKDLLNTPGNHYNTNTKELFYVSEAEAMANFYGQMLSGDTVDNIPGIKGVGPAKAKKALAGCNTPAQYEAKVMAEYSKVYEAPEKALEKIGQLLWMRRIDDEVWYPNRYGGPLDPVNDIPF